METAVILCVYYSVKLHHFQLSVLSQVQILEWEGRRCGLGVLGWGSCE